MLQKIINNKKFGPIAVGNPTLENFPKHSNLVDAFNDLRITTLDIFEVRSQTRVHSMLTRTEAVIESAELNLCVPREYSKFEDALNKAFRSEKNPKPKFRLEAYEYNRE